MDPVHVCSESTVDVIHTLPVVLREKIRTPLISEDKHIIKIFIYFTKKNIMIGLLEYRSAIFLRGTGQLIRFEQTF